MKNNGCRLRIGFEVVDGGMTRAQALNNVGDVETDEARKHCKNAGENVRPDKLGKKSHGQQSFLAHIHHNRGRTRKLERRSSPLWILDPLLRQRVPWQLEAYTAPPLHFVDILRPRWSGDNSDYSVRGGNAESGSIAVS